MPRPTSRSAEVGALSLARTAGSNSAPPADLVWLAHGPRELQPHDLPAVSIRATFIAGVAREFDETA